MKVVILRGLPGSGKSHFAQILNNEVDGFVRVVSADDYFTTKGHYDFDPRKLSEAHAQCFKKYLMHVIGTSELAWGEPIVSNSFDKEMVLIVDNTNINRWEISPYLQAAVAFKMPAVIYTVQCDTKRAYERNIHKVPERAFDIMLKNLVEETPRFLPWWVHYTDRKEVLDFLTGDRKVN